MKLKQSKNAGGYDTMSRSNNSYQKKDLSLSQNFLTSQKLLRRIVRLSSITKNDTVIEIGTGKGHLTRELSQHCKHLYSIELDQKLYAYSKQKLADISNLSLIHRDFLTSSLPTSGKYKVFANIPYFITTEIIRKLTEASNPPTDIWLVVEKGAAKRFMGQPKETLRSVLLKANWESEIVYYFKREDFHPKPAVDSVLLRLTKKDCPDVAVKDYAAFAHFIDHSFRYGLFSKRSLLTKKQISTALRLAKLPAIPQSGLVLYIQWLCLFRCYQQFKSG